MTPDPEIPTLLARQFPELFRVSTLPSGVIRLRTPLTHPDGTVVDVFVSSNPPGFRVSDLGDTLGLLETRNQQLPPEAIEFLRTTYEDLEILPATGTIHKYPAQPGELAEAGLRVAQAAVQLTALAEAGNFSERNREPA